MQHTHGISKECVQYMVSLFQVYLGTSANAENLALLKQWHIQYLLNCDGGSYIRFRRLRERYGAESGVLGMLFTNIS